MAEKPFIHSWKTLATTDFAGCFAKLNKARATELSVSYDFYKTQSKCNCLLSLLKHKRPFGIWDNHGIPYVADSNDVYE
jgi:hypothetical protein